MSSIFLRQYARLVEVWVIGIGLRKEDYGTHSLRRTIRVRNDQSEGKGAWPFDIPFRLILNLAIGGDWAGKGIDDAAMPQRMEVDYVCIWEHR